MFVFCVLGLEFLPQSRSSRSTTRHPATALLNIRLRHAFPAILLGVVLAGLIVLSLTYGVIHVFG